MLFSCILFIMLVFKIFMDNKNLSLFLGYIWIFIVYIKNINCYGMKEVFVINNKSVVKFIKFDFI